jgi:hypothetical protein
MSGAGRAGAIANRYLACPENTGHSSQSIVEDQLIYLEFEAVVALLHNRHILNILTKLLASQMTTGMLCPTVCAGA